MDDYKFPERLRELRLKEGLTQSELASKCGLRQSNISAWEIGIKAPLPFGLIALAKYFKVSIDYLVGLDS